MLSRYTVLNYIEDITDGINKMAMYGLRIVVVEQVVIG